MLRTIVKLYDSCVVAITRITEGWFLGLAARLIFASTLYMFFINSALTKLGEGAFGFLNPSAGAYAQIVPAVAEQFNYNVTQIPLLPYGLLVLVGTWAEFILPTLLVLGLFTRLAAAGMICFIAVMTYVDIVFHGVGAKTIGSFFDKVQDSPIVDQRLLWLFLLLYLMVKGAGTVSIDRLLRRLTGF